MGLTLSASWKNRKSVLSGGRKILIETTRNSIDGIPPLNPVLGGGGSQPISLMQDNRKKLNTPAPSKEAEAPYNLKIQQYLPPMNQARNMLPCSPSRFSHFAASPRSQDRRIPLALQAPSEGRFRKNGSPEHPSPVPDRPLTEWSPQSRKKVGA